MRVIKFQLHPGSNELLPADNVYLKLVYLDNQEKKLFGWFEEGYSEQTISSYKVYLALTGEEIPTSYQHIVSHQISTGGGFFLVHAYAK